MFKSIRLSTRLYLVSGVLLALMAAITAVGMFSMAALNDRVTSLATRRLENLQMVNDWTIRLLQTSRHVRGMLIMDDRNEILAEIDGVMEDKAKRKEYMEALSVRITIPEAKAELQKVIDARNAYVPAEDEFLQMVRDNRMPDAKTFLLSKLRPLQSANLKELENLLEVQKHVVHVEAEQAGAMYRQGIAQIVSFAGISLFFGIFAAWRLGVSVNQQLGGDPSEAARAVEIIAGGDLSVTIATNHPGSLMGRLEAMRCQLNSVIQRLRENADRLSTFSAELATASAQVASGAHNGSDAASSMAAAVEQMTVSISQISDNASEAARTTTESGQLAESGGARVLDLARSMSSISHSVKDSAGLVNGLGQQSAEIRSIVGVIKEIADQTNLLALNAAIEAARAGETGRGFAVVADEVRKLAERTTQSTQDIAKKIETIQGNVSSVVKTMGDSVETVIDGEKLAGLGAEAIGGIKSATGAVAGLVNAISNAIRENSSSSQEVARKVEHIAQLSEENSGAAKQVAMTAGELTRLASELSQVAGQFKTA